MFYELSEVVIYEDIKLVLFEINEFNSRTTLDLGNAKSSYNPTIT